MWTARNAKDVKTLLRTFKPQNRFVLPEFAKHCAAASKAGLFKRLQERLTNKLAGWHALEMASAGHVCLCCQNNLLPAACNVCPDCQVTEAGRALSGKAGAAARAKTIKARYGVTNAMHSPKLKARQLKNVRKVFKERGDDIREKRVATSLALYGTDVPAKSEIVRKKLSASVQASWDEHKAERLKKTSATSQRRYGTDFPFQSEQVMAKHRTTCLDQYGHKNAAWGEQAKVRKLATNLKKFGKAHPMQNKSIQEKGHQTNLERYGVRSPLQRSEIRKQAYETAKKLTPVVIGKKTFLCQGYEKHVLPLLVKKFGVRDLVGQFDKKFVPLELGAQVYCPDFYVTSKDTYVEVKSTWTLWGKVGTSDFLKQNRRTQKQANANGVCLKFVVFDEVANRCITLPQSWTEMTRSQLQKFVKPD